LASESPSRFQIRIKIEDLGEVKGELTRFSAPRTVDAILRALPIEGKASIWKDEVYFETPVKMGREKEKDTVETGTIAYWPLGSAFCIFYGKSQPYSPVNILGKVTENLDLLKNVRSGMKIVVEKIS
jgi:hypothetical protein